MEEVLTYQQILAQQYDENEYIRRPPEEFTDADGPYTVEDNSPNSRNMTELADPQLFQQFAGNRNLASDVIQPSPFEDKSKQSVRYNKDVRTTVVNIDSRFRAFATPISIPQIFLSSDPNQKPPSAIVSTAIQGPGHFLFRFNRQMKNVVSIKLSSLELPNTFANISASRGNSCFGVRVNGSPYFAKVDIAPLINGVDTPRYFPSPAILASAVQAALIATNITGSDKFTCAVNSGGYIQISNSSNNVSYDFDFLTNVTTPSLFSSSDNNIPTTPQLFDTLGSVMGFSDNYYDARSSPLNVDGTLAGSVVGISGACVDTCNTISLVTGTYNPNLNTDDYIYMQLNDYDVVSPQSINNTYFPVFAKIPITVAKGSMVFDTEVTNTTRKIYYFIQPSNINTLDIKLLDRTGVVLSGTKDYSMTLEIEEVVSQALYEKLREL